MRSDKMASVASFLLLFFLLAAVVVVEVVEV